MEVMIMMNKKIVITSMVFIIMLVVSLFIKSEFMDKKESQEVDKKVTQEETHKYESTEKENNKNKVEEKKGEGEVNLEYSDEGEEVETWAENPYGEDYETPDLEPQEIDESEQIPTYAEMFDEKDIKDSEKVAMDFVKIFHNVDHEEPLKYIKKSKKYMSDEFYEELLEKEKYGEFAWMYGLTRRYKKGESYEPILKNLIRSEDEIIWNIEVEGTYQIHDDKTKKDTNVYTLRLKKINNEYKVVDYLFNQPF